MSYYTQISKKIPKIKPVNRYIRQVDVELLKSLFKMQTPTQVESLQRIFLEFILTWCADNAIEITHKYDAYGNLYITKGKSDLYPCVVSHVDTVHDYNKHLQIISTDYLVFGLDTSTGEQHGIGADPKNGVYFALEMLKKVKHLKVVLFMDEEVGCIGSKAADMQFFNDCSFVMQLDRRSFTTDIIEHTNGIQVLSEEFKTRVQPIIEEFHYEFGHGTCTDVGQLVWNKIGICCFNFSNGSFNEHMNFESCSIPHLLNAVNAGYQIINKLGKIKRWEWVPPVKQPVSRWTEWDGDSYWDSSDKLIYEDVQIKTFVHEQLFNKRATESNKDAVRRYYYNERDEEDIKWQYEYMVGFDVDDATICKKVSTFLRTNYSKYAEVRTLCLAIDAYVRTMSPMGNIQSSTDKAWEKWNKEAGIPTTKAPIRKSQLK